MIDITELQSVRLTRSDMERYSLAKGDLLVCEGGEVGLLCQLPTRTYLSILALVDNLVGTQKQLPREHDPEPLRSLAVQ